MPLSSDTIKLYKKAITEDHVANRPFTETLLRTGMSKYVYFRLKKRLGLKKQSRVYLEEIHQCLVLLRDTSIPTIVIAFYYGISHDSVRAWARKAPGSFTNQKPYSLISAIVNDIKKTDTVILKDLANKYKVSEYIVNWINYYYENDSIRLPTPRPTLETLESIWKSKFPNARKRQHDDNFVLSLLIEYLAIRIKEMR